MSPKGCSSAADQAPAQMIAWLTTMVSVPLTTSIESPRMTSERTLRRITLAPCCVAAAAKARTTSSGSIDMGAFREPEAGNFTGMGGAPCRLQQLGGHRRRGNFESRHEACLRGRAPRGAAVEPQLVVAATLQQLGPSDVAQQFRERVHRGPHEGREMARVGLAPECGQREARGPRHELRHAPQGNVQRPVESRQQTPEAEQQPGRRQRLEQFGGDVPGVAEAGPGLAGRVAIDEQHAVSGARQHARHT